MKIGVISDTHGVLRPQALAALRDEDVAQILHAGDIGSEEVLRALQLVAPTTAVRGNTDHESWCAMMPRDRLVELAGRTLYLIHDPDRIAIDPAAVGVDVVIFGHTHTPLLEQRGGALYLNPGSAGPRRSSLPATLALLTLGDEVSARIVELQLEQ
jgi:uncharacterized protein